MNNIFVVFAFLFFVCAPCWAACPSGTCRVATDGVDDGTCGADGDECATIDYAVDSRAADGDTVFVENGTYYEHIDLSNSGSAGNVITIEGESKSGVIIDGSDLVTAGSWSHYGDNIYSQSYTTEVGAMYVVRSGEAKEIPRCRSASCLGTYMPYTTSQTIDCGSLNVNVVFWNGIDAMFVWSSNTLYVKFGDYSDPGSETIRVAPEGENGVFDLTSDSYITIKNMTIRGGWNGVYCYNSGNIMIQNCEIYSTGRAGVWVQSTGSGDEVTIDGCTIYENALGFDTYPPGAWDDDTSGTAPTAQAVKNHIYSRYKGLLGDSGGTYEESCGVCGTNAQHGVTIKNSTIYDKGVIIWFNGNSVVDIYDNTLYNSSSAAYIPQDTTRGTYYNNLIYDNNFSIRVMDTENTGNSRYLYIYNNRMYNPIRGSNGLGKHTNLNFNSGSSSPSVWVDIWFYHNSMAGGQVGFYANAYVVDHGDLKGTRWINNIISPEYYMWDSSGGGCAMEADGDVEVFGYNWIGGTDLDGCNGLDDQLLWFDEGLVDAEGTNVWDNTTIPDFSLPGGHAAKDSGIDITAQHTIDSVQYDALPWAISYYDEDPDMGYLFPPSYGAKGGGLSGGGKK